ncbi:MAG TPA: O-antigen ligase family protein [Epulopiscium sp.]|nr:O-antigen ligase family protein [Candidatus Epulonipiscium sp.]
MNHHTEYEGKRSKVTWPLAIILAVVPLIVRLRELKLPQATKQFWDNGSGTYADFFSINKVIVLGILTLIGVIFFIKEYIEGSPYRHTKLETKTCKNKIVYSLLGIYTFFAILSTVMAKQGEKIVALVGVPGRYEGLITILFYVASMILAMYVAQEWWNIKSIYKIFILGAFVLGLIGVGQFLKVDFFQLDGGKALILPAKYLHLADQINFAFNSNAAYTVYATLFHANYVGSYTAMLMPISLVAMAYTFLYNKDKEKRFYATIFALTMIITWFACHSRGGLVGGGFALLLILILLYPYVIKTKVHLSIVSTLIVIVAILFNIISGGTIGAQLISLPKEVGKLLASDVSEVKQIEDIKLEQNAVEISSNLPFIRIEKDGNDYVLKTQEGAVIPISDIDGTIVPQDTAYTGMHILKTSAEGFRVMIANPQIGATYPLDFTETDAGMRIIGSNGNLLTIEPIEKWGFRGKERVGSSRGYIWSRTLPMMKDTWLVGYGPDTYSLHFPQHDVIGKINAYDTARINVDKPHNLYLQIIVSTGFVSLLAFIGLFITYFILWLKHMKATPKDDIRRWMSMGIFVAICGYLIAGLFNDSVVSVAPVFWVLWGLGMGLTGVGPTAAE